MHFIAINYTSMFCSLIWLSLFLYFRLFHRQDGFTALMWAAYVGNQKTLTALLELGANFRETNKVSARDVFIMMAGECVETSLFYLSVWYTSRLVDVVVACYKTYLFVVFNTTCISYSLLSLLFVLSFLSLFPHFFVLLIFFVFLTFSFSSPFLHFFFLMISQDGNQAVDLAESQGVKDILIYAAEVRQWSMFLSSFISFILSLFPTLYYSCFISLSSFSS